MFAIGSIVEMFNFFIMQEEVRRSFAIPCYSHFGLGTNPDLTLQHFGVWSFPLNETRKILIKDDLAHFYHCVQNDEVAHVERIVIYDARNRTRSRFIYISVTSLVFSIFSLPKNHQHSMWMTVIISRLSSHTTQHTRNTSRHSLSLCCTTCPTDRRHDGACASPTTPHVTRVMSFTHQHVIVNKVYSFYSRLARA